MSSLSTRPLRDGDGLAQSRRDLARNTTMEDVIDINRQGTLVTEAPSIPTGYKSLSVLVDGSRRTLAWGRCRQFCFVSRLLGSRTSSGIASSGHEGMEAPR